MDFPASTPPVCLLMDNGSLQPASTLALRRLATAVSTRTGTTIIPVSLLHSNRVPREVLDGEPAEILAGAIRRRYGEGLRQFVVLPLFFGPSGALTAYLPEQISLLAAELPGLSVKIAAPVAGGEPDAPDPRLARILADHVRRTQHAQALPAGPVVLVDHGSPQRVVAVVRDALAAQLARELGTHATAVIGASMERRPGDDYAFNEPLLARALASPPCGAGAGDVVLAPLFFSPGRHAGPGGDIAAIVAEAVNAAPGLHVHTTALVGEHPLLVEILADRYHAAVSKH